MDRCRRNLKRLLEMQYQVEDIMGGGSSVVYRAITNLLDACADELEVLFAEECGETAVVQRVRDRVEQLFCSAPSVAEPIEVGSFVRDALASIGARHGHREIPMVLDAQPNCIVSLDRKVLRAVLEGLVRNAIENTPDQSRVEVEVQEAEGVVQLEVRDFGVGIREEDQFHIFQNIFTTREPLDYSTKNPYDFNSGGKGFDLLRMKVLSERHGFRIRMESRRCRFLKEKHDLCPGQVALCQHCRNEEDCAESGGTRVIVEFPSCSSTASDPKGGG